MFYNILINETVRRNGILILVIILECPGVVVEGHGGGEKCYIVFNGKQNVNETTFTYNKARKFCYSSGGQLPVFKSTEEKHILILAVQKYDTDPVSAY